MKKFRYNSMIKKQRNGFLITALIISQLSIGQSKPDPNYKGVIGKTLADS